MPDEKAEEDQLEKAANSWRREDYPTESELVMREGPVAEKPTPAGSAAAREAIRQFKELMDASTEEPYVPTARDIVFLSRVVRELIHRVEVLTDENILAHEDIHRLRMQINKLENPIP